MNKCAAITSWEDLPKSERPAVFCAQGGEKCSYPRCLCDPTKANGMQVKAAVDAINPSHYRQGGIECIEAIEAALTPEEFRGYLKGQIFKYCWRTNHKGGLEDLKKAQWYMERLIAHGSK